MTNEDWQVVARSIESVPENWSELAVGSGLVNVGSYGRETTAATVDLDPCATLGSPAHAGCTMHSSTSFSRKRTHLLASGEEVWDFGGSRGEWVQGSLPQVARAYVCALTGADKLAAGPAGTYAALCPADGASFEGFSRGYGLGYVEGSGGKNVWRGGFRGAEGSVWATVVGIFYTNTNPFWNTPPPSGGIGFRCAFEPAGSMPLALLPARTRIATAAGQRFRAHGGTAPYAMTLSNNASGATFDPAAGLYRAGPRAGLDTLTITDGRGQSATASVAVVVR